MIPRLIHFVYVGGRPFSFVHFLAVLLAARVNQPATLVLHCSEVPDGPWWAQAAPLLELHRVAPVREVMGNPVHYPAHQADVIRLAALAEFGGIYLDLDVLCLRPLTPWLDADCVLGIEPGSGLCNAVILARPSSAFIRRWQAAYADFDGNCWNRHSVVLPGEMARAHPEEIRLAGKYDFFYPTHNDPVAAYLWGETPDWPALAWRLGKNLLRVLQHAWDADRDPVRWAYYTTFHGLRGRAWHIQRLQQSYCLHLWEGLWGSRYLQRLTPAWIRDSDALLARRLRSLLSSAELAAWDQLAATV